MTKACFATPPTALFCHAPRKKSIIVRRKVGGCWRVIIHLGELKYDVSSVVRLFMPAASCHHEDFAKGYLLVRQSLWYDLTFSSPKSSTVSCSSCFIAEPRLLLRFGVSPVLAVAACQTPTQFLHVYLVWSPRKLQLFLLFWFLSRFTWFLSCASQNLNTDKTFATNTRYLEATSTF